MPPNEMIPTNQKEEGEGGTLSDEIGLNPPEKTQAMEMDLMEARMGEREGRGAQLGEGGGFGGEWVAGGPTSPPLTHFTGLGTLPSLPLAVGSNTLPLVSLAVCC